MHRSVDAKLASPYVKLSELFKKLHSASKAKFSEFKEIFVELMKTANQFILEEKYENANQLLTQLQKCLKKRRDQIAEAAAQEEVSHLKAYQQQVEQLLQRVQIELISKAPTQYLKQLNEDVKNVDPSTTLIKITQLIDSLNNRSASSYYLALNLEILIQLYENITTEMEKSELLIAPSPDKKSIPPQLEEWQIHLTHIYKTIINVQGGGHCNLLEFLFKNINSEMGPFKNFYKQGEKPLSIISEYLGCDSASPYYKPVIPFDLFKTRSRLIEQQRKSLKCIIIGALDVGKNSFIVRAVRNEYTAWPPHVNHYLTKNIDHITLADGTHVPIGIQLWNTVSSVPISQQDGHIRGWATALVLFDTTQLTSLNQAECYLREIKEKHSSYFPRQAILIGTKSDLIGQREVSTIEGLALARQYGCPYFEISAKNPELSKNFSENPLGSPIDNLEPILVLATQQILHNRALEAKPAASELKPKLVAEEQPSKCSLM